MRLYDGRSGFYQYDTNQKLICESCQIGEEVHFSNNFYSKAAVCKTYELEGSVVVDVPNMYLLNSGELIVYRMCVDSEGRSTIEKYTFPVLVRKKPSDYVYTETEVMSYHALEERIEALEQNGGSDYILTDSDKQEIAEQAAQLVEVPEIGGGLTVAQISALDGMFKIATFNSDPTAAYNAFKSAFGIEEPSEPDVPDVPVEPDEPHTHSYTSEVTTAATCTTAGVKTYTCSCGDTYTEAIPATGHTFVDGECTECGAVDPDYVPEEPDSEELMCEANIVKRNHTIAKNAEWNFYNLGVQEGSNVYEIPVEAGATYELSVYYKYSSPIQYCGGTLSGFDGNKSSVLAEKLPDLETVGSNVLDIDFVESTYDANVVQTKLDTGEYKNTVTFTPTIDGYFYCDDRNIVLNGYSLISIKKAVA